MKKGFLRILVIKLRYLGDVLLTTPVFDALRSGFPDAFIAAAVNRGTEDMLTGHPAIDKIFTVETGAKHLSDWRKQLKVIKEIRNEKFDMVLDLTWNDRAAMLACLSGAKTRLSHKTGENKGFYRAHLFTELIEGEPKLHIVNKHLELAKALGCSLPSEKPTLYFSPQDQSACEAVLKNSGVLDDPYVVLHPSSNALHKVWTAQGYAALCDDLLDKWNIRTILVSGREPEELRLNEGVCHLAKSRPLNLGGRLTLKQSAVLLSKAVLFIGIDSGPMHMAAAVNTPVLAIFGPSRAWRWGPCGQDSEIVQKDWPCVPCGKKGCAGSGKSKCLDELSLEEVTAVLEPKIKLILQTRNMKFGGKSI